MSSVREAAGRPISTAGYNADVAQGREPAPYSPTCLFPISSPSFAACVRGGHRRRTAVGAHRGQPRQPPAEVSELLDRVLQSTAQEGSIDREDDERLLRVLHGDTVDVLATEGFFSPRLTITVDDTNEARYAMRLELGPRTKVSEVEILFKGAIETQPERVKALRARLGIWPRPAVS